MFVEEYLIELKRRGYTPAAFARYASNVALRARDTAYRNPDGVRSVLVNGVGFLTFFLVVSVLLATFFDGKMARRLMTLQGVSIALGTTWMLLHLGLLKDRDGIPLSRIGLANQLSFLRLLMIPAIYLFILEGRLEVALAAYGLASVTDVLDGYVARRFRLESRLGLVMDPIVDVGYVVAIFTGLYRAGWIPSWLAWIVWSRYALLFGGGTILYLVRCRVKIRPTAFGRVTGVLTTALIFFLLGAAALGRIERDSDVLGVVHVGLGFFFAAACVQLLVIGVHNLRGGDERTVAYTKVAGSVPPSRHA